MQRAEQLPHITTPIPRELWIEMRGPVPSLETAVNIAVAAANDYVRQLAFGANAWQGLMNVHLAYDSSKGANERQFFQNWIVDERGLPRVARDVDTGLMYALLVAISQLPVEERARVSRAVLQYTDALQYWKPGSELYALSHLYMGVEALTPIVIRREVARRALKNRSALENALNGPPADSIWLRFATWHYRLAGGYKPNRLDPWARREIIFRGDRATYSAAQKASNQLEHGLAHHAEILPLAAKALGKTAEYLREAILDILPLSGSDRQKFKAAPYAAPVKAGGFERQLLGTIRSDGEQLVSSDQTHPYVRWEFNLLDYKRTDSGAYEMQLNQKINPVLAPNVKLTIDRIVFAGPSPTSHTNVEFDVTRGDTPKEELVTHAGAHLAIDLPRNAEWANLIGRYILNANALPHLARFWLTKIDPSLAADAQKLPLSDATVRISALIKGDAALDQLVEECESLWKEAVDAIELRELLSVAFTGEQGLIIPCMPLDGRASTVTEPDKLRELNDRLVELAKKLATLLDAVLAARGPAHTTLTGALKAVSHPADGGDTRCPRK